MCKITVVRDKLMLKNLHRQFVLAVCIWESCKGNKSRKSDLKGCVSCVVPNCCTTHDTTSFVSAHLLVCEAYFTIISTKLRKKLSELHVVF